MTFHGPEIISYYTCTFNSSSVSVSTKDFQSTDKQEVIDHYNKCHLEETDGNVPDSEKYDEYFNADKKYTCMHNIYQIDKETNEEINHRQCSQQFMHKLEYDQHIDWIHRNQGCNTFYQCLADECDKCFIKMARLINHIQKQHKEIDIKNKIGDI